MRRFASVNGLGAPGGEHPEYARGANSARTVARSRDGPSRQIAIEIAAAPGLPILAIQGIWLILREGSIGVSNGIAGASPRWGEIARPGAHARGRAIRICSLVARTTLRAAKRPLGRRSCGASAAPADRDAPPRRPRAKRSMLAHLLEIQQCLLRNDCAVTAGEGMVYSPMQDEPTVPRSRTHAKASRGSVSSAHSRR